MQELLRFCEDQYPDARAAVLGGSTVWYPGHRALDRDLVVVGPFPRQMCPDLKRTFRNNHNGVCLEVSEINESTLEALLVDPILNFYYFRVLTRVVRGQVISGLRPDKWNGLLNNKKALKFRLGKLEEMLCRTIFLNQLSNQKQPLEALFRQLQIVLVSAGFLFSPEGPVKPKWYLAEAALRYPQYIQNSIHAFLMRLAIDIPLEPEFKVSRKTLLELSKYLPGPHFPLNELSLEMTSEWCSEPIDAFVLMSLFSKFRFTGILSSTLAERTCARDSLVRPIEASEGELTCSLRLSIKELLRKIQDEKAEHNLCD